MSLLPIQEGRGATEEGDGARKGRWGGVWARREGMGSKVTFVKAATSEEAGFVFCDFEKCKQNCAVDCADAATLSVTVVLLGSFVFLL